jgi:hypothetical protein
LISDDSHHVALAAAYCRGRLGRAELGDDDAIAAGQAAGLRLHRFKRTAELPRVRHADAIAPVAAAGRIVYGEWLYAKHTVFYDRLPHYFMEFDVFEPGVGFLSTARRRELLAGAPIASVPVLWEGVVRDPAALPELVGPSLYKSSGWRDALAAGAEAAGISPRRAVDETDPSDHAEGLYIKVEEGGTVVERYKWIRASFLTAVADSGTHWLARPILPNRLADGVEIFP